MVNPNFLKDPYVFEQSTTKDDIEGRIGEREPCGVRLAEFGPLKAASLLPLPVAERPSIDAEGPKTGFGKTFAGKPVPAAAVEHAHLARVEPSGAAKVAEQRQVEVLHTMADADFLVLEMLQLGGLLIAARGHG